MHSARPTGRAMGLMRIAIAAGPPRTECASMRDSTEFLIRSVGLSAETFASADQFLKHHRPSKPACLVLDTRTPGLSGLDLQNELAQAGVEIPIVPPLSDRCITRSGSCSYRSGLLDAVFPLRFKKLWRRRSTVGGPPPLSLGRTESPLRQLPLR